MGAGFRPFLLYLTLFDISGILGQMSRSICYACRPKNMPHLGDYYFPDGFPKGSSNCTGKYNYQTGDIDEHGKAFHICYTEAQIRKQYETWGFFAPFIPLYVVQYQLPLPVEFIDISLNI